ncbi:MAG TPA: cytidine deaminase [Anaerolineae bacterium]
MSNQKRKTQTQRTKSKTRQASNAKPGITSDAADAESLSAEEQVLLAAMEVDIQVLIDVARNMRERAYAPYSGYPVGAALLTAYGSVYGGCNVENAAYGATICAERSAVVKAVGMGEREFAAIAVVTEDGGTPCGECRQVLTEFGNDTAVIIADVHGHYSIIDVDELLPFSFNLRGLEKGK